MEASLRVFNPSTSLLLRYKYNYTLKLSLSRLPPRHRFIIPPKSSIHSSLPHPPNSNPPSKHTPLPFSQTHHHFPSSFSTHRFARILSGSNHNPFEWNFTSAGFDRREFGFLRDEDPIVTVVLLGWLGAQTKHLRRYVELYNSWGFHAVTFVASVRDVLSFDLGRKLEERVSGLANELGSWLEEREKDGRERVLIFHTFSNTGWLAYGAILDSLQGREDLLMKIKGCVVDSGGDPEINPKVWAAGFTAALLKKHSSAAYPSVDVGEQNEIDSRVTMSKIQEKEPLLIETLLLLAFEKLFSHLLNLPAVNQRLTKIVSVLSKKQPPCPQLYFYSSGDKVIPFRSVESFVDEQRKMGRKVKSFNFGISPHVDHYRNFPDIYSTQIQYFLKECLEMVKQV